MVINLIDFTLDIKNISYTTEITENGIEVNIHAIWFEGFTPKGEISKINVKALFKDHMDDLIETIASFHEDDIFEELHPYEKCNAEY